MLKKNKIKNLNHRWLALRLLEKDTGAERFVVDNKELSEREKSDIFNSAEKGRAFLEAENELDNLSEAIASALYETASRISKAVTLSTDKGHKTAGEEKLFTNRISAYFVMLVMLSGIFYITIAGANYPSQWLSAFFNWCELKLMAFADFFDLPELVSGMLISGGFRVLGWVVSVMLPPMAIFFPCFTLIEDLGVLPRVAYVLDNSFSKAKACGKQALTTCMGYGCNCVGISGARIIDSKRERNVAILTNSLTICNGRFPAIITLISLFLVSSTGLVGGIWSAFILALIIVLSLALTLVASNILSRTLLKGESSHYILEIPPYRRPQISKVIVNSVLNRTLLVLFRAVVVAFPAGIIIWLLANVTVGEGNILSYITALFSPLGKFMGMDGSALSAFFLGIPANEIVLPITLMSYLGAGEMVSIENASLIGEILRSNGWTHITAICYIIFSVVHFPCATALLTIYKETKSKRMTLLAFVLPTVLGIVLCAFANIIGNIWNN